MTRDAALAFLFVLMLAGCTVGPLEPKGFD